ncbi:MAG: NrdH-redoxin [Candidatus Nealsonbacteria bacterium]|nr:MAG: NrdH-redoxin [Candidatus Nealsonbacteria bacterium]
MSKVKIFLTPSCPYCFTLKEFLKEHNIKFKEIDVSKDEKAREEMIKKTGKMEVPVVEIDGQIVVGFDKKKICKLLNIKE